MHHSGLCTNSVCTVCPAQAWVVRRLTAWYLSHSRRCKTHVCIQRLVGILQRQREKIFAFIRRCIHTGFCSPDLADFHDLYISSDEKLFNKILTCPNHILRTLLPPPTAQNYSLRNRPQNIQLCDWISRIHTHTHTHTRLTALFRDYPGESVPER